MATTDNREDYLINILRLSGDGDGVVRTSELSDLMGVSPASVSEMVKTLSEEGLVDYVRYKGATLTERGRELAMKIRRKHHIAERFLTDVMDMDMEDAHQEACRFEHHMSDESADKLCRMIGPKIDDDCAYCTDPCHDAGAMIGDTPLSELEKGGCGRISYLKCEDAEKIKKLISMGFVPGRDVSMVSAVSGNGPRIVKVGDSAIALDKELSSLIYIESAN
ncbi:MAG: metal-dependent transcriptional regulator [Thermoplasmatales archaeon]|nr:metal-dependent transcriptional regulator [Thermoplasmatales archaeon]